MKRNVYTESQDMEFLEMQCGFNEKSYSDFNKSV